MAGLYWGFGEAALARGSRGPALAVMIVAGMLAYFGSASIVGAMQPAEVKAFLRRDRKA